MSSDGNGDRAAARTFGAQSLIDRLDWVLVHRPASEYTAEAWSAYGLEGVPDLARAQEQHDGFVEILKDHGAEVAYLEEHTSIQTSATFDPALITNEGAVILQSGRRERQVEGIPMARRLTELGIPIIGWVRGEGVMDGGDTTWLDANTLIIGCGYRTNEEGVRQLRHILDGLVPEIISFDNPHFRGPGYVIHLMSYLSLVAEDVAVVYSPLMPVRLRNMLLERGYRLVEVPDAEFASEGCNVLALEPGKAVMVAGNPITAAELREHDIEVIEFEGDEICVRRKSGPTCNSRPLRRTP
jgi:N-dimethylarginine dimethylaminohydrolase